MSLAPITRTRSVSVSGNPEVNPECHVFYFQNANGLFLVVIKIEIIFSCKLNKDFGNSVTYQLMQPSRIKRTILSNISGGKNLFSWEYR